jgi:methylated-DNA-protein-cysteine methyltransferase-like protein
VAASFGGIAVADSCGVDRAMKKNISPQSHPSTSLRAGSDTEKSNSFKDISPRHRRGATKASEARSAKMRMRIEAKIRAIPKGKVSTYGAVARAAGFPGAARFVARVLGRGFGLPWQRVLGAGGHIKCTGDSALEQRFRLEAEGVHFRGRKVDMKLHEFKFRRVGRSGSR